MTIGKRIQRRRMEIGMSQEELAKKMGYQDRSTISMVETGRRDVPWENVVKYATVLNCSPYYLMKWQDPIGDEDLGILEEVYSDSIFRQKLMDYAKRLKELLEAEKELTDAEDAQIT